MRDVRETVNEVWTEVLGAPADPDADFFDLGGHSLLATQLVARLDDRLGVRISIDLVFDHPVLGELADAVEEIAAARKAG